VSEMAAEYPPERPGESFRFLPFPCGPPPDRNPEPAIADRRDGSRCDVLATLGARRAAGATARADRVRWDPV
jgi:hypothetical protein